ncbi:MAG: hypothetical protein ACRDL0_23305 [Thermoleophilaceae bacterium]
MVVEDVTDLGAEFEETMALEDLPDDKPIPALTPPRRSRAKKVPATVTLPVVEPDPPLDDVESDEPPSEPDPPASSESEGMVELIRVELGVELTADALELMLDVADFHHRNRHRLLADDALDEDDEEPMGEDLDLDFDDDELDDL